MTMPEFLSNNKQSNKDGYHKPLDYLHQITDIPNYIGKLNDDNNLNDEEARYGLKSVLSENFLRDIDTYLKNNESLRDNFQKTLATFFNSYKGDKNDDAYQSLLKLADKVGLLLSGEIDLIGKFKDGDFAFNEDVNFEGKNNYVGEGSDFTGVGYSTAIDKGLYGWEGKGYASLYMGNFVNGKRQGQGKLYFINGDKFEGNFDDGKVNGQGTYTDVDGSKYVGEYKNGILEGKCTYTRADGMKYEGQVKNGKCEGKGILTFPDGTEFNGKWKDSYFMSGFVTGKFNGKISTINVFRNSSREHFEVTDGELKGKFISFIDDGKNVKYEIYNKQKSINIGDDEKKQLQYEENISPQGKPSKGDLKILI